MYCRILVLKITPIHIVYVNQYITVVYSRMYCVTDSLLLSIVIKNKCFYYCYTMLSLQTVVNNTFSYLNTILSHILQWQFEQTETDCFQCEMALHDDNIKLTHSFGKYKCFFNIYLISCDIDDLSFKFTWKLSQNWNFVFHRNSDNKSRMMSRHITKQMSVPVSHPVNIWLVNMEGGRCHW